MPVPSPKPQEEILRRITRATGPMMRPEELFRAIARELRAAIPCQRCSIAAIDGKAGRELYWHRESDLPIPERSPGERRALVEWHLSTLYAEKKTRRLRTRDLRQHPWCEGLYRLGLRSLLLVPILQGGECVAHIALASTDADAFTAAQAGLAEAIAAHLAPAIRSATLYQTAEARAARLAVLNEVNIRIAENLTLDETLAAIVRGAVDLLAADQARILLLDEGGRRLSLRAVHGALPPPAEQDITSFEPTRGIMGRAMAERRGFLVHDVQEDPLYVAKGYARANGVRGFILQPLRAGDRVIGGINCMSREAGFFDGEDLKLLGALAAQAAIAIEKARLLDEARSSRDFFQSVIDDNTDPITISDADLRFTRWNAAAEKLYGYREEEVIGRHIRFLIPPSREGDLDIGKKVRESPEAVHFDTERRRKDGTLVPVSLTISPIRDRRGEVTAYCAVHKDLTDRRRTEEQLRRAKEEAEAANQAKSDFLANMSHEIRTPMNGVLGMTGMLLDTPLNDAQRGYAGLIRASAEGLLAVINDILDFSKIEAGQLAVEPAPFDLLDAIEAVVGVHAPKGREKGLDLLCRFAPGTPRRLIGDGGRIRQVLANLVGNAIKFTEEGHVLVEAGPAGQADGQADRKADGKALVRVAVTDTGIGIPEEARAAIFGKFSQADPSITRRYGGTGLGLAISQRLVGLMGGEIGLESRPGQGSTFWFQLPLAVAETPTPSPSPPSALGGVPVLLVSDSPLRREILAEQMGGWGMKCTPLEAAEADGLLPRLEQARREEARDGSRRPVVLFDVRPRTLNLELLALTLRKHPAGARAALVLITPPGTEADSRRLAEAGMDACLARPLHPDDLAATLGRLCEGKGAAPERERPAPPRPPESVRPARGAPPARVLLVEDMPVNQLVARGMLEKLGCRVDLAADGAEALRMLDALPYDLVLMDCQMPGMDGFEATHRIRRKEAETGGRVPIVAMTALAMRGDRERCLAAGMDDHIPKPVEPERLAAACRRWLGGRQGQAAPPAPEAPEAEEERKDAEEAMDAAVFARLRKLEASQRGPGLVAELVGLFLRDAPEKVARLREALARGEAAAVERTAHALKGSSGNMGARRMMTLCAELEARGGRGALDGCEELIERIAEELARARAWFSSRVKGRGEG